MHAGHRTANTPVRDVLMAAYGFQLVLWRWWLCKVFASIISSDLLYDSNPIKEVCKRYVSGYKKKKRHVETFCREIILFDFYSHVILFCFSIKKKWRESIYLAHFLDTGACRMKHPASPAASGFRLKLRIGSERLTGRIHCVTAGDSIQWRASWKKASDPLWPIKKPKLEETRIYSCSDIVLRSIVRLSLLVIFFFFFRF